MRVRGRWDPCIAHRGPDLETFLARHFGDEKRKVLLVAGAGFDPRARIVAIRLSQTVADLQTLLVKELRPRPDDHQSECANANTRAIVESGADTHVEATEIFDADGAVVGGRNVVGVLDRQHFEGLTDVTVDISALSVGTMFPIVRYLLERFDGVEGSPNLHVFVVHDPKIDAAIRPTPSDIPSYIHGFKGGSTLSTARDAARLWLPQLASGQDAALRKLHNFVGPHDTCPILPFPASDPRLGDALAEEYLTLLEEAWEIDPRNLVYADEEDPLDLYRTILRLDERRRPVFEECGGSMLVLSPLGSKVMALGALMAALERDLPVAHLEAFGYEVDTIVPNATAKSQLVHVWLAGSAYPSARPLSTEGDGSG